MSAILIPVLIVTVIGLLLGLGLALASKFMAVPTDEKEAKIYAPNMIVFSKDEPDYCVRLLDDEDKPIPFELE